MRVRTREVLQRCTVPLAQHGQLRDVVALRVLQGLRHPRLQRYICCSLICMHSCTLRNAEMQRWRPAHSLRWAVIKAGVLSAVHDENTG